MGWNPSLSGKCFKNIMKIRENWARNPLEPPLNNYHFIIILVVALGKFSIPDYECSVPL